MARKSNRQRMLAVNIAINRQMPLILCDYMDTCDEQKHTPLLEKLAEYKKGLY